MNEGPATPEPPALERLLLIRARGPYEEWLARTPPDAPLPGLVTARLPHHQRPDPASLSKRLAVAAAGARQVEHQSVLHCYGTQDLGEAGVAQILELNTGTDLEGLFTHLRGASERLPMPLVAWLFRHAAEAVAHAHSLGIVHGSLSPALVALLPSGEVRVDFGLAGGAGAVDDATLTDLVDLRYTRPEWTVAEHPRVPAMDVWALGAMLLEALTGEPPQTAFDGGTTTTRLADVPDPLRAPLAAALDPKVGDRGAAALANALARVFYKTLGADDEADGRGPLSGWVEAAGGGDPAVLGAMNDHADTVYPAMPRGGPSEFTQALRARAGPVQPRDFTTDDFALEPSGPDWAGAGSDATTAPPPGPVAPVPPEERVTAAVISTPDLEAPKLPVRAPGAALEVPPSQSSSISDVKLRRPARLTWFLAGYAATLVLLILLRKFFS